MSYKWTTGSVRRGDIYFEDDRTGAATYIDFGEDTITLRPSGSAILFAESDKVGIGTTSPGEMLEVAGNIGLDEYIYHNGDSDTFIRFEADEINIEVGGENMIYMNEGGEGAQADKVTINNDLADVDFQVKGASEANLIRTEAATDRVGIRTDAPTATLYISGSDSDSLFGIRSDSNIDLFVVTGSGKVGVGTPDPKVALDVHDDPTALSNDTGGGTVVKFGTDASLTAGKVYYFHTNGVWTETDADAVGTGADQLLGISLGTDATIDGILIQGFFDATTYLSNFSTGKAVYLSTTAASMDTIAPAGTGDFVRVVGWCTDTANVIYFNPSGDWVELA